MPTCRGLAPDRGSWRAGGEGARGGDFCRRFIACHRGIRGSSTSPHFQAGHPDTAIWDMGPRARSQNQRLREGPAELSGSASASDTGLHIPHLGISEFCRRGHTSPLLLVSVCRPLRAQWQDSQWERSCWAQQTGRELGPVGEG